MQKPEPLTIFTYIMISLAAFDTWRMQQLVNVGYSGLPLWVTVGYSGLSLLSYFPTPPWPGAAFFSTS